MQNYLAPAGVSLAFLAVRERREIHADLTTAAFPGWEPMRRFRVQMPRPTGETRRGRPTAESKRRNGPSRAAKSHNPHHCSPRAECSRSVPDLYAGITIRSERELTVEIVAGEGVGFG